MQYMRVVVSACLIGIRCRYDGKSAKVPHLLKKLEGKIVIPLCPEQMGGLPTPREESVIVRGTALDVLSGKGKVITKSGKDVTKNFIRGAKESYKIAKLLGIRKAYFKDHSPSCGVKRIFSAEGKLIEGNGVTASLFSLNGIEVISI